MKHTLIKLWISVLAFCVGVSVSSLWRVYLLPKMPASIAVNETVERAIIAAPTHGAIVGGIEACGPKRNFHSYVLADGSIVSVECRHYGSASAVKWALQRELRGAGQIASRWRHPGEDGEVMGETILAVGESAVELNTNGKSICVTRAASLKHLQSHEW